MAGVGRFTPFNALVHEAFIFVLTSAAVTCWLWQTICVYIFIYLYIYIYIYIHIYIDIYIYIGCASIIDIVRSELQAWWKGGLRYTYECIHIYIYTYTYMYICIYVYTHMLHMYLYTCTILSAAPEPEPRFVWGFDGKLADLKFRQTLDVVQYILP